jgi:K+-transporting ATPase ATPase C chain
VLTQLRPAIVSLVLLSVITGLAYPALVTAIAQLVFSYRPAAA